MKRNLSIFLALLLFTGRSVLGAEGELEFIRYEFGICYEILDKEHANDSIKLGEPLLAVSDVRNDSAVSSLTTVLSGLLVHSIGNKLNPSKEEFESIARAMFYTKPEPLELVFNDGSEDIERNLPICVHVIDSNEDRYFMDTWEVPVVSSLVRNSVSLLSSDDSNIVYETGRISIGNKDEDGYFELRVLPDFRLLSTITLPSAFSESYINYMNENNIRHLVQNNTDDKFVDVSYAYELVQYLGMLNVTNFVHTAWEIQIDLHDIVIAELKADRELYRSAIEALQQ